MRARTIITLLATALAASAAYAEELRIGTKLTPSSLDPHYFNSAENESATEPVFDKLVAISLDGQPTPSLATAWENIDPLTWRITIRPDVKFHNGDPLLMSDVIFSIERIKSITGTPGGYLPYVAGIESITDEGGNVLLVKTAKPDPMLAYNLTRVSVVQEKAADGRSATDFNQLNSTNGTGPYAVKEYVAGSHAIYEKNPHYWGSEQPWDTVTVRYIGDDAARMSSLLAGDVDLVDAVPTADIKRLEAGRNIDVSQRASVRIQYYGLDVSRQESPFAKGPKGENPLVDVRVREAISLAIDRKAIVDFALDGSGTATSEFVIPQLIGEDRDPKVAEADLEKARALLADAGYESGFELTIHSGNDRYPGADRVVQATAQSLARIGIKVNVALLPNNIFFPEASKQAYSFFFLGYGTLDSSEILKALFHSRDENRGFGMSNRGRYSNEAVDALIQAALGTFDTAERMNIYGEAFRKAIDEDFAYIPLYYPVYVVAFDGAKLGYDIPLEGYTSAIHSKRN